VQAGGSVPDLGADTECVLERWLGMSAEQIAALSAA
jgi:hypothetical protein